MDFDQNMNIEIIKLIKFFRKNSKDKRYSMKFILLIIAKRLEKDKISKKKNFFIKIVIIYNNFF